MGAALAKALPLPAMGPPLPLRTWLLAVALPGHASQQQAASSGAAGGTSMVLTRVACALVLVWAVVYAMMVGRPRGAGGQHMLGSQKPLLLPIKVGRSLIMRGVGLGPGAGALSSKGY